MKYNYLPYNKSLRTRARELRNNPTAAEKKLWYCCLKNHKYIFLRQKLIDNYIVDFYCSKLKLVVEVDGGTHLDQKDILYDNKRTEVLKKYELKVLRFYNDDIINGVHIVSEIIEKEIKKLE